MKKIIGILGMGVIVMALFFNTNKMNNSNDDLDLASLIALNTANAESSGSLDDCVKKTGSSCGGLINKTRKTYTA